MNNYYLHFERYADGSLLHIGVCDDSEKITIFDATKYSTLYDLAEEFIRHVSKNKTEDASLYFHEYKEDKKLINDYIRDVDDVIIKANAKLGKENGNSSGKPTIFLYDSRKIIKKDLSEFDEEFNLAIKNDAVINTEFFTPETYNTTVSISDYTEGLDVTAVGDLSSYVTEKQEEIKNTINLDPVVLPTDIVIPPIMLPTELPTEPVRDEFYIAKENLNMVSQPNDASLSFNPTTLIIESTYANVRILKRGLSISLV